MHLSLSLSPPPGICNGGRRKEEDGPTLVSPRFMRGGGDGNWGGRGMGVKRRGKEGVWRRGFVLVHIHFT